MKQYMSFVLLIVIFCNVVLTKNIDRKREARWFGYRYTSTMIKPKMVTSLVPSSCVQVEPSLPPCRNVRKLKSFPQIVSGRIFSGDLDDVETNDFVEPFNSSFYLETSIGTTPLGWGEYFGIIAPTVTVTAVHLETVTVMDPNTVVTFSVKGCRPSRLPLDLGTCEKYPGLAPSPTTKEIMTSTVFKPEVTPPGLVDGAELEIATEAYGVATEDLTKK